MGPETLFWACGCETGVMWLFLEFVEAKSEFLPTCHWSLGVLDVNSGQTLENKETEMGFKLDAVEKHE